ncbi:MAG TPA: CYTH domain-containing protein, partial [Candidatus Nanoarchaeia archaeon]|nr:CYTH domain-containing protein [Candidatus Nanoarchaeia archaeon]
MKEVEVKILEVDVEEVHRRLVALGAERTYSGSVVTFYLDTGNERLKRRDESLRVRQIGDSVKLCYKGSNQSKVFKSREEIEFVTGSLEATLKLMERLGFEVRKKKT